MVSTVMRNCVLLALASALTCLAKDTKPEQIHIAFAGKDAFGMPTGMSIAWYTKDLTSSPSTVKYGTVVGKLSNRAIASQPPGQYLKDHGYHHAVAIAGLTADTKYYYSVGSDADGWSSEWSFQSPPSGEAASKKSISVSIFGDMGYEDSAQRPMEIAVAGLVKKWSATVTRTRLEAMKDDFDMVWLLGDVAYADDAFAHSLFGFTYEECYNGYMNWMQNLSATKPFMVSVGNHESECHSPNCVLSGEHSALSNFSAYNARFHMPSAESGGRASMWYSFNYGPVHFVSVNTETDFPKAAEKDRGDSGLFPAGHFGADGEYLAWLEADLKAASEARSKGNGPRWIVAGGHRPFGDIKDEHVPLFKKYGVDLFVAGHGHSYARGQPVDGVQYIMVGGAGCDEMNDISNENNGTCKPSGDPNSCDPYWSVGGPSSFKTGRMATGVLKADAESLDWRLIDSVTGQVLDEVKIGSAAGITAVV